MEAKKVRASGRIAERAKAKADQGVVLPAVKSGMLKNYGVDTSRRWDIVHPSELSHQETFCPRAVYLRITEGQVVTEKFDFVRENIFEEGNQIHTKWQKRLQSYTKLWGDWHCLVCGDHIRNTPLPSDIPKSGSFCYRPQGHLWEYQEIALDAFDEAMLIGHADGGFDNSLVEFKGLSLDTPLPTPSGWTTMGDVQPGDMLLSSNGKPTKVLAKSSVKHKRCYLVSFDDGTTQICDEGHLWPVFSGVFCRAKHQVLSVEEIQRTLRLRGQSQHRVLNVLPVDLPESDLPFDPYILGQWLGDGTFRNGSAFICGQDDQFETLRQSGAVLGNPNNIKPNAHDRCVHGLSTALRKLGLAGVKSPERWIPAGYLRGSISQRLALLQGLMDSDGSLSLTRKQVVFTTTSEQLAEGVRELAVSLGSRVYIQKVMRSGFGVEVLSYDVRWSPSPRYMPFRMGRKIAGVEEILASQMRPLLHHRVIRSVEEIPTVPTACVMVDAEDHTYLCGRAMLPTHNSVGEGTVRIEAPTLYKESAGDLKKLWQDIHQPFRTHLNQGDIYLWIARQRGLPFTQISYVYESKWNQLVKEFVVEYSEARSLKLVDIAKGIKYAVEQREEPACRFPGTCTNCKPYDARRAEARPRRSVQIRAK